MTENKGDLISREALKKAIEQGEGFSWDSYGKDDLCVRKKYIDNAPTVEPEPIGDYQKRALELADNLKDKGVINNRERGTLRRAILLEPERPQGEWNYIQAGMCVCPFCGAMPHKEYKNFCAKCGADMRGAKNDNSNAF